MLNCRDVTERASDFLDAAVPFRVGLQVRLHLLMCRFCREYVRQMELVVRVLRQLPRDEPPAQRQTELMALFRAERQ